MAQEGLGLEERTDWLLRRSAALLKRGPAPRAGHAPSRGHALSHGHAPTEGGGDPLLQWRLRRRAEPCWASRDPREAPPRKPPWGSRDAEEEEEEGRRRPMKDGSRDALRGSCDSGSAAWGQPCWTSRDPGDGWRPMGRCSHDALRSGTEASHEAPVRSRDPREAPQPIGSSSQEPLRGRPCWTSRDPCEAPQPIENSSQEPLRGRPCWTSRDPREAPQPIGSSSQDALQPPKDDGHAAPVDPILRLLRRRRRLLWQSLRAVDSALATLPHQSH